jgi:uncharacterized protein YjbI with pentapeptide repeats
MKRIPLGVAAATPCLSATWCSAICLAAFMTIISASATTDAQTSTEGLNAAEQCVVAQVTRGEVDLSKQFPKKADRQLSADFLETLLMDTRPDVKLNRHGVRIIGAIIDESIDLDNAQIPREVALEHCQFNARVTFVNASFAGNVSFAVSAFKAAAIFNFMKVRNTANFISAVFEGPVNFAGAEIPHFYVLSAKFKDKKGGAGFYGMRVADSAVFDHAVFEGLVVFSKADMARDFEARGAEFQNKEKTAKFNGMKVGGDAFFNAAVFEGGVDFSYADFGRLDLSGALWPKGAAHMQAMSYKSILAASGELESHKALLDLVSQAAYSADVYSHLEEFFLRQGYRAEADKAFIEGKRHERREKLHGLGWLGSWLLDALVGYGRRPWQAGIPCAVLVALGCILFSPKKMEPQQLEDTPRVYNRFWYSLGLFLPFVDLQSNKVWKPKADQTFLRNYMRVHILLGWILVPLVLAAVTGLIK